MTVMIWLLHTGVSHWDADFCVMDMEYRIPLRRLIPLSKWVITPVINGISRVNPLITGVITHLLSGMILALLELQHSFELIYAMVVASDYEDVFHVYTMYSIFHGSGNKASLTWSSMPFEICFPSNKWHDVSNLTFIIFHIFGMDGINHRPLIEITNQAVK